MFKVISDHAKIFVQSIYLYSAPRFIRLKIYTNRLSSKGCSVTLKHLLKSSVKVKTVSSSLVLNLKLSPIGLILLGVKNVCKVWGVH